VSFVRDRGIWHDMSQGAVERTGNPLDVAVDGTGFLVVQTPRGDRYTRNGSMQISQTGQLVTSEGYPVLGDGGPITLPPYSKLDIGSDGSIALVPLGQGATTVSTAGTIKLVNPDPAGLERGPDGLMRMKDGSTPDADSNVKLASGALEASNVNPSISLVRMIELSRQFEMQMQGVKNADENAQAATRLLQAG
jgi:flagellar basal-body rod protein FlgF